MSLFGSARTQPRIPPLGETATLLNEALSHRAELTAIELDEARSHVQVSAMLGGICALLGLLGGVAFTLIVTAVVWDNPHRGWWLAGLCAVYLAGATTAGLLLRNRLRAWRPFAEI